MSQGAPGSPLVFVMVADGIRGDLRPQWEFAGHAWTCDVMLSYPRYADDILLLYNNKAPVESVVAGVDRNSAPQVRRVKLLQMFGQDTKWEASAPWRLSAR